MFALVNKAVVPIMTAPTRECELADEALYGMKIEILEDMGEWVKIRTHYDYTGYVEKCTLLFDVPAIDAFEKAEKRVILKPFADLMQQPKVQSHPLATLARGAVVAYVGEKADKGWVSVMLCDGRIAWTRTTYIGQHLTNRGGVNDDQLRQNFVDTAMVYLGAQYRWGGKTTLGIDCSGLCSIAYMLNGVIIHRDASMKPQFCMHSIEYKDIKKGDLMFFPGHVAMYIEDGKFIHATSNEGDEGVVLASLKEGDADFRPDLLAEMKGCGSIF